MREIDPEYRFYQAQLAGTVYLCFQVHPWVTEEEGDIESKKARACSTGYEPTVL